MSEQEPITIYGVKINQDGEIIDQWQRQGGPIVVRGLHTGYNGGMDGQSAYAESEQSEIHALDIARMVLKEMGGVE